MALMQLLGASWVVINGLTWRFMGSYEWAYLEVHG